MTDVKERILKSATELFTTNGYQNTSIRQIASDAGVEPSLIIRHFTSKDSLFLRVINIKSGAKVISDAPKDKLGQDIVRMIIDASHGSRSDIRKLGALLSVTNSDRLREEMRINSEAILVTPIAKHLTGKNRELRASLIATQITGLMLQLYVMENRVLLDADKDTLVELYAHSLQALIDDQ